MWWGIHGSKRSQIELLGWLASHDKSGRNVIIMVVDVSRYKHLDRKDPKAQIKFSTIELSFQMLQTFDSSRMIKFVFYKNLSTYKNLFVGGIISLYNQKSTYNNKCKMVDWVDYLQFGLMLMENSNKYETMHSTTIDT
jgi:hypothetical protein